MKLNYSKNFWIIAVALFFYMISFNVLLPEMNEFISDLGGEELKGLIIALFTVFAGLSRPFSGKLSDLIGRKKVMMIGMAIGAFVTLLYPLSGVVMFFLSLRLLHGFSAGFLPTGATAMVSDVLAPEQRGRGMGIWGVFISLGIGVGQYLGTPLKQLFGMNGLFMIATGACLFA
ncbi:MAG: MFS transporter, partial [Crocinitomicaceae bacterium]